jgi:hypothetical protein
MADEDDIRDEDDGEEEKRSDKRDRDFSKNASVKKDLLDCYKDVAEGFQDQWNRANDQMDYWDIYNSRLTSKQFYSGNSRIFIPIVKNAVDARKTRFTNQIFPQSGRYVECTSTDGTRPSAITALLEHYVRKAKLRTQVMPALVRAGDVSGQYNVYVSWVTRERHVTFRTKTMPKIEGTEIDNPVAEEIDDIKHEEIEDGHPEVEVIADSDILVLPQTADCMEEALAEGGSVTVLRRWSKAKIKKMIDDGAIRKDEGDMLMDALQKKSPPEVINADKKMVDAAGIKGDGKKHALVYETYKMMKVPGHEDRRLCQIYFGGEKQILGCHLNPLWCDKLPLLSVPVDKVAGAFKGRSKIEAVADLQYAANDAVNMAWDSAAYALLPIVMTDPEKNPRVGSMVLSMAAVWETSPKDTSFATMPHVWEKGFELVNACKSEVSQTLSVSPAAITQGVSSSLKSKPNQAMVAQEQQIDILTTADAVTVLEEGILTPMLNLFLELDHQYRDEEITVRQFGEMGLRAGMEEIPPVQMEHRYVFRWFGVEQARSAQQIQQQIAGMNVIRGIPPQQLNGYQVNLVPIITQLVENTFGPRLAPLIFVSPEQQLPVPADQENAMLGEGYEVPVHKMDDDKQHIQAHQQALQMMQMQGETKNAKKFLAHVWQHIQQAQAKQQAAMQAQQGAPGVPGGAGPGVAGSPRVGAQPGGPRTQGPPGMIHQDQMRDPSVMPRKVG